MKISHRHDLVCVAYDVEGDDNLYFYAYEKGKILGFLNFGKGQTIKFQNAYIAHKIIPKIVSIEFLEGKNGIFILLSDELLFLNYKRTPASMTFMIKIRIKMWQIPLKLANSNDKYHYDEEEPLHGCGMQVFEDSVVIVPNKVNIIAVVESKTAELGVSTCNISH